MFRNLYFFSPNFRNHNFSDFFDDIREDSEVYLEAALKEGYADGGLEPYFYSILPLTMSPESCASFIRANPQLPITERDYYLSKLFQFLYVPIKIRFSLEDGETDVREKVQEFLDTIPDAMLPQLRHFDWEGFYFDSRSVELNRLLVGLPAYLPSRSQSTKTKDVENETPAAVIDRLRKPRGWTIEQVALEAEVDVKQIYRIKRGEGVHTDTIRKIAQALGCKPGELMPF